MTDSLETTHTEPKAEAVNADNISLRVTLRVNKTFDEEGLQHDEIFVNSDDPYLNFKFNLEGEHAKVLKYGFYTLGLTPVAEIKKGEVAPGEQNLPTNPVGAASSAVSIPAKVAAAPAKDLSKTPKPIV